MKQIPQFSVDLIKQLVEDEPQLDIKPNLSHDVIMYRAGRWSVLRQLVERLEFEDNNTNEILIKGD